MMFLRSKILGGQKWNYLSTESSTALRDSSSCDVTLVCDELIPFQAHKIILSSCSTVLKCILLDNPHNHPLVFLPGVKKHHLRAVLEFAYHGEVVLPYDGIDQFLALVKNLEIKELFKTLTDKIETRRRKIISHNSKNRNENKEHEPETVLEDLKKIFFMRNDDNQDTDLSDEQKKYSKIDHSPLDLDLLKETFDLTTKIKDIKYVCNQCDYKAVRQTHMRIHQQSVHEGIKYKCNQCEYQATQRSNLKKHQQSKHDFVQFTCNTCNYAARRLDHLKTHQEAVHEGVKYSCKQCRFQTSRRGHLNQHQRVTHEGKRFNCGQCKYETKNQSNLKKHKESQHDGIMYPCNQCQYQTGWEGTLRKHKNLKHGEGETKLYSCTDCKYVTKDSGYLKKHIKAKHDGVRYNCNVCEFHTGWETDLRKHKKVKHASTDFEEKNDSGTC